MSDGWNPREKYRMYLNAITDLLGEEKRTVRDVYYALEATGFEAELNQYGHKFAYKFVKRAVKKGRRHGYIDPELIVDTSRSAENKPTGYASPEAFLESRIENAWRQYAEDPWGTLDTHVEVWLEKQSLASVFAPICREYNVRLEATRGDWSDSKVYEATHRLVDRIADGDDVRVLYFGDYNPSGYHAPVSVQETMSYYGIDLSFRDPDSDSKRNYFDIWPLPGAAEFGGDNGTLAFERVGINTEHINRFDLPENPNPSETDKDRQLRERFRAQVSDGNDTNVELNALKEFEREYLESLVEDAITQHLPDGHLDEFDDRVNDRREQLREAITVDRSALDT